MTKEVINIGDIVKYEGYPNNLYKVTRIKPNGDVILDCIKGAYHCIPYANVEKISLVEVKDVDLMKEIADIYEANYEEYLTYEEFADIAKHFFELGLKAKQG